MRKYLSRIIPLAVFVGIALLLGVGLTIDATRVPSPLVGQKIPAFDLPDVSDPANRVQPRDLRGEVWLLNVWATWCAACEDEPPVLMTAADEHDLTIVELDHKDERDAAVEWLRQLGNPYVATAFDPDGRVGLDLGVYGVPPCPTANRNRARSAPCGGGIGRLPRALPRSALQTRPAAAPSGDLSSATAPA